jgi:hypothetical protein
MTPVILALQLLVAQPADPGALAAAAQFAAKHIGLQEYAIDRAYTGASRGRHPNNNTAVAHAVGRLLDAPVVDRSAVLKCSRAPGRVESTCQLADGKALMRVGPIEIVDGKTFISVWVARQFNPGRVHWSWLSLEMKKSDSSWTVAGIAGEGGS